MQHLCITIQNLETRETQVEPASWRLLSDTT